MSWKNVAQNVPVFGSDTLSFPFIQWINYGSSLEPVAPLGGFGMPELQANLAANYPASAELRGFNIRSGKQVHIFFTHHLEAAILATRFAWIKDGNFIPNYAPGARSKLQALAVVKGVEGPMLVTLTFSGMASSTFSDALKAHRERIRDMTAQAGHPAPASIFYATLAAGEPVSVGKKGARSLITPVYLVQEEAYRLDVAFVGQETLEALVDWEVVQQWYEAWRGRSGPNGDGTVGEEDDEEAAAPAAPVPVPASTPQHAPAPAAPSGSAVPETRSGAPALAGQKRLLSAVMRGKGYTQQEIAATLKGVTAPEAVDLLQQFKGA